MTGHTTKTHSTKTTAQENRTNVTIVMCDMFFFCKTHRGPEPYTSRRAMQRSRFDMRGAGAGAGGMSISSGSGGASGMGASSSPSSSVSSAIAHIGGPSSAGVWCDVPGEEIIAGMERRGLFDCIPESAVAVGRASDANQSTTPGWRCRGP